MAINYHYDLIQNTDEWLQTRLGLITASQMKQLVTEKTMKTANNKESRGIVHQLASERITKEIGDNYQSWDMLRGQKEEVLAVDLYSKHYAQVKSCGFITNNSLGFEIGMSPDGLVDENGGIEVKSRSSKYQVETIINGVVPSEFKAQVQGFFLVTEREWCDFVSYSNGMHMYVERVLPDKEWQEALIEAVTLTESKINEMVQDYKEKVEKLHKAPWVDVMAEERGDFTPSTEEGQLKVYVG